MSWAPCLLPWRLYPEAAGGSEDFLPRRREAAVDTADARPPPVAHPAFLEACWTPPLYTTVGLSFLKGSSWMVPVCPALVQAGWECGIGIHVLRGDPQPRRDVGGMVPLPPHSPGPCVPQEALDGPSGVQQGCLHWCPLINVPLVAHLALPPRTDC